MSAAIPNIMPRFVILEHNHPHLHWDLMLERDGVLRTWRLPAPPTEHPRTALALGEQRNAYHDYEGLVSGNRGTVTRWDRGSYETLAQTETSWEVCLRGGRWQGRMTLTQAEEADWVVCCEEADSFGRQT
jgi:hypothetical protein